MIQDVPYMMSVTNLHKILDAIQRAGAPEVFHRDFLKDLGFKASGDRGAIKVLKFLGLLDPAGRPQAAYREFMDHTKAKQVLAARMRSTYDDLFTSDRNAHTKSVEQLKGWFKTKTGAGDAVAQKMASTFRSLASYGDFDSRGSDRVDEQQGEVGNGAANQQTGDVSTTTPLANLPIGHKTQMGLVYRFEILLPDTQNVDTYRAIFRALREELM